MSLAELYAPAKYWDLTPEVKRKLVNGCGTGGWLGKIVPETIYGLSVKAACNIHDYMYHVGETMADKEEADNVFLNNMIRIIDANTRYWFMRRLRYNRARVYYEAVEHFGGPAFWSEKNEAGTMYLSLQAEV